MLTIKQKHYCTFNAVPFCLLIIIFLFNVMLLVWFLVHHMFITAVCCVLLDKTKNNLTVKQPCKKQRSLTFSHTRSYS